jgi:hypothetical protein
MGAEQPAQQPPAPQPGLQDLLASLGGGARG